MHLALYSVRRRVTIRLAPHTPSTYSSTYSGKLAYNHFIHALLTDLDRRSFTSVYNYANATSLQVYLGPFTAATSPPGTRVRHAVNENFTKQWRNETFIITSEMSANPCRAPAIGSI